MEMVERKCMRFPVLATAKSLLLSHHAKEGQNNKIQNPNRVLKKNMHEKIILGIVEEWFSTV